MFEELDLLLPERAFDAPMQMALDEVLLRTVVQPTLRIYRWTASCVTFGYFQKIAEVRAAHRNLVLVRRRTGGGIVEHGDDLTFSLIIPGVCDAASLSPVMFYKKLHQALADFLTHCGKKGIHLAREEELLAGPSCFSAPARDDLLCEGKKILGGAQCRSGGNLLYQGSLQGIGDVGDKMLFSEAFARSLSRNVTGSVLPFSMIESATNLAKNRYGSESWNERR